MMDQPQEFVIDKMVLFTGGYVPSQISSCISQETYREIYTQVQECYRNTQTKAFYRELSCLCLAPLLLATCHQYYASILFEQDMSK